MSVDVEIDESTGVAVATLTLTSSLDDVGVALRQVYAHPAYRFRLLWDCREVDTSSLDSARLRGLAAVTNALRPDAPPGRAAIVVSRPVDYGIARMAVAYNEGKIASDYLVVDDYDEALAWLREGLD